MDRGKPLNPFWIRHWNDRHAYDNKDLRLYERSSIEIIFFKGSKDHNEVKITSYGSDHFNYNYVFM